MAASSVQNPPTQTESKSSKKKKAKTAAAELQADSPAAAATPDKAGSVVGNSEASENAYIRDLKKNIRNTSKKISNASKTQTLIAENKDKTIEQLLSAKIINADQKRQVDNKPALEAELARYEEQLAQVQKLDDEWRNIAASAKIDTERHLTEKFEQEKAEAIAEAKAKVEAEAQKSLEDGFLVLSQFLRLAAHRRGEAPESTEDEDMALEGVLLSVYAGDRTAVDSMIKLYKGTDDATTSVAGEPLQTTYATVKSQAAAYSAFVFSTGEEEAVSAATLDHVQSDPTIIHAGLTEIDAGTDKPLTNGHVHEISHEAETAIPSIETTDDAANVVAESQWDKDATNDLAASQEWVEVQKPAEPVEPVEAAEPVEPVESIEPIEAPQPEAVPEATPAAPTSQSWADDHPEPTSGAATPSDPNDGFQSVQRNRGRGDREGGFRGGRGHHRGRGSFAGNGHRGRGRGGSRGGGRGGFNRNSNEGSS